MSYKTSEERFKYWQEQCHEQHYNMPPNHSHLTTLVFGEKPNPRTISFYIRVNEIPFRSHVASGGFLHVPAKNIIDLWEEEFSSQHDINKDFLTAKDKINFYSNANGFKMTDEDALFLLDWAYKEDSHFLTGGIYPTYLTIFTPHFHNFTDRTSPKYLEYMARMELMAPVNVAVRSILSVIKGDNAWLDSTDMTHFVLDNFINTENRIIKSPLLGEVFRTLAHSGITKDFEEHYIYPYINKRLALSDFLTQDERDVYFNLIKNYSNRSKTNSKLQHILSMSLGISQISETEADRLLEMNEKLWFDEKTMMITFRSIKENGISGRSFPNYFIKKLGEPTIAEYSENILLPNKNFSDTLNLYLKLTTLYPIMVPNEKEIMLNEAALFFEEKTGLSMPDNITQAASIIKIMLDEPKENNAHSNGRAN